MPFWKWNIKRAATEESVWESIPLMKFHSISTFLWQILLFALKIVEDIHIRPLRAGSLLKSSYIPYIYIYPSLRNIKFSENFYWIYGEGVGCRTIMVGVLVKLALQDMPSVSLLWAFSQAKAYVLHSLALSTPSLSSIWGSIPTQISWMLFST